MEPGSLWPGGDCVSGGRRCLGGEAGVVEEDEKAGRGMVEVVCVSGPRRYQQRHHRHQLEKREGLIIVRGDK